MHLRIELTMMLRNNGTQIRLIRLIFADRIYIKSRVFQTEIQGVVFVFVLMKKPESEIYAWNR
jgi:hypothetical protein